MRILEMIPLMKDGKEVATLKVYFEGSGNPADDHNIVGVSISGYGIGEVNEQDKVDEARSWNI